MLYIQKDFQPSEYTVRQFRRWKTMIAKSVPACWNPLASPTRKDEIAKARTAYEMRPRYHHVSQTAGQNVQTDTPTSTIQRRRASQLVAATQPIQLTRNRSQTGRGQKRTNAGTTIGPLDQETPSTQANASQRPHRQIIPSRRALESTGLNTRAIQNNSSHHMEIDSNDDT
jgi:hypothetical protein